MENSEKLYRRHVRIWRVLYALAHGFICRRFRLTHDDLDVEGPVLLVPNHVTNWDPLLVAMSLKKKQVYYVATEHLFRLGFVSKLLVWFLGPIARPKGGNSLETVRKCVEHLKAGHSICLFAEGEATWDGKTHEIFPATGKLVKMAGATLVTYRLEGGYLSLPRWRKTIRCGKTYGHTVHIYKPDELAKMSPREINDAINRDIYEDAWAREKELGTVYKGKAPAEGLERGLYLCPSCRKIGTLRTENDRLSCDCGLTLKYSELGFEETDDAATVPFPTFAEWDAWQQDALKETLQGADPEAPLFSDDGLTLTRVSADHTTEDLGTGRIVQYTDRLQFRDQVLPLSDVTSMAMVQAHRLLFSTKTDYYELTADKKSMTNLRKYLRVRDLSATAE